MIDIKIFDFNNHNGKKNIENSITVQRNKDCEKSNKKLISMGGLTNHNIVTQLN